jgi:hypothetical protein
VRELEEADYIKRGEGGYVFYETMPERNQTGAGRRALLGILRSQMKDVARSRKTCYRRDAHLRKEKKQLVPMHVSNHTFGWAKSSKRRMCHYSP